MKMTEDAPSGSSIARTLASYDERSPGTGRAARDTWQFGQERTGPWVRLRDRTRARAASRALGQVTLAELLGTDEDEGPWVSV